MFIFWFINLLIFSMFFYVLPHGRSLKKLTKIQDLIVISYFVSWISESSTYFKECVLWAKRASPLKELEFTGPEGPEILVSLNFLEQPTATSLKLSLVLFTQCTRLVKFLETVLTCSKGSVWYLASLVKDDNRTLMGRTISRIAYDCNVARISLVSSTVRTMPYFTPPVGEDWRIPLLTELLDVRDRKSSIPDMDPEEIEFMINDICMNWKLKFLVVDISPPGS